MPTFNDNFKRARNAFKRLVRNKSRQHKEMQNAEIEKAYENQKYFWALIRKIHSEKSQYGHHLRKTMV